MRFAGGQKNNQKSGEKVETVRKTRRLAALINKSDVAHMQDLHFYTESGNY